MLSKMEKSNLFPLNMDYLRPCYFKHHVYSVFIHIAFTLFLIGTTPEKRQNFPSTNIISFRKLNFQYPSANQNQNKKP